MRSSAYQARQIAQELPEGVRVVAILTPGAPAEESAQAAAAVCDFTRAVASERGLTVLVDLAAPDGPLATLLGSTGARGLAEVLAGTASVREVAVPSDRHGFIYLPPGREATCPGPGIGDRRPAHRLQRILEKARTSGATLVLHRRADREDTGSTWEMAEGSIAVGNVEIPAAAPALLAKLRVPGQRAVAETPTDCEPPAEEGGRRVIAAGRWESSMATMEARSATKGVRVPTHHRKRSRGQFPDRRSAPPNAIGIVLTVALLSSSLLIVFWVALGFPTATAPSKGAATAGFRPAARHGPIQRPRDQIGAPRAPARDSLPIPLPSTLPFSTFSTGYVPEAGLPDTTKASRPTSSERKRPR